MSSDPAQGALDISEEAKHNAEENGATIAGVPVEKSPTQTPGVSTTQEEPESDPRLGDDEGAECEESQNIYQKIGNAFSSFLGMSKSEMEPVIEFMQGISNVGHFIYGPGFLDFLLERDNECDLVCGLKATTSLPNLGPNNENNKLTPTKSLNQLNSSNAGSRLIPADFTISSTKGNSKPSENLPVPPSETKTLSSEPTGETKSNNESIEGEIPKSDSLGMDDIKIDPKVISGSKPDTKSIAPIVPVSSSAILVGTSTFSPKASKISELVPKSQGRLSAKTPIDKPSSSLETVVEASKDAPTVLDSPDEIPEEKTEEETKVDSKTAEEKKSEDVNAADETIAKEGNIAQKSEDPVTETNKEDTKEIKTAVKEEEPVKNKDEEKTGHGIKVTDSKKAEEKNSEDVKPADETIAKEGIIAQKSVDPGTESSEKDTKEMKTAVNEEESVKNKDEEKTDQETKVTDAKTTEEKSSEDSKTADETIAKEGMNAEESDKPVTETNEKDTKEIKAAVKDEESEEIIYDDEENEDDGEEIEDEEEENEDLEK